MKSLKWIIPLVILAITLGGCPYNGQVPIDKPSVKINPQLIGTWEARSSSSDYKFAVSRYDDLNYKIVKSKKDGSKDGKEEFLAHLSHIDGTLFMNVHTDKKSETELDEGYYYYKVELNSSGTKLTLWPLTENIREKFSTSEELKAFITKNKSLSFFYDKEEEYIKD